MQYVFGTGVSDLDDLVLNSLGAWSGALIVMRLRVCRERKAVPGEERTEKESCGGTADSAARMQGAESRVRRGETEKGSCGGMADSAARQG